MEWMDWPLRQVQAIEGLPGWLRASLPTDWMVIKVLIASVLAYAASLLAKRLARAFGKWRLRGTEKAYEGSLWDMIDSGVQAAVILIALPFIAGLAGFDSERLIEAYGEGIIGAVVIIIGAVFVARWVSRAIRQFGEKARLAHRADGTLFAFMSALITYAIMGLAIVLALTQLGVQTASLIALVGAAGLAIALALQDTLKGVAGGVMLAIFRPYRLGDWVRVADMEGEVVDITPFRTTIKPVTNQAVSLPNDQVWTNAISNSSRFARRRLDLYLDISYDDDIDHAIEVTLQAVNALSRVLAKSETWVGVNAFRDSSVQLRCRVWVSMPEYVQMKSDCLRAIKAAYDAHAITIPYPHNVQINMPAKVRSAPADPVEEPGD